MTPLESERQSRLNEAASLPSVQIGEEAACLLDLLATGALGAEGAGRLPAFTPELPLPCGGDFAPGQRVVLRDAFNERLAILQVETAGGGALTGRVEMIQRPRWRGFAGLRKTPAEVRAELGPRKALAWMLDALPAVEAEQEAVRVCRRQDLALLVQVTTHCAPPALDLFTRVRAARDMAARLAGELDRGCVLQVLPCALRDGAVRARIAGNCGAITLFDPPPGTSYHPAVRSVLDDANPPRHGQGFCVWFTGLPSSGKSAVAGELATLIEEEGRKITFLDGDVVRTHLSKGLGFSREDRDTNVLRIGWVASRIVWHHGAVICAAVSPYESTRERVRSMVGEANFILIHVDTPLEVCESRDVKGFYAQARAGVIQGFTGVDDPYQPPARPSLVLMTVGTTPYDNALGVLEHLRSLGFLAAH